MWRLKYGEITGINSYIPGFNPKFDNLSLSNLTIKQKNSDTDLYS